MQNKSQDCCACVETSTDYYTTTNEMNLSEMMSDEAAYLQTVVNMMVWLKIAELLLWYVVITSIIAAPLYLFVLRKLWRNNSRRDRQCLLALMSADLFMLLTNTVQLLLGKYLPTETDENGLANLSVSVLCKNMVYVANTTSMFTNWCWVLMWSWRYLSVFHPWRHLRADRQSSTRQRWLTVLSLLVVCLAAESWYWFCTTAVITPSFESNGRPQFQCSVDKDIAGTKLFRWVAILETSLSFAVPFFLTLAADVSVLIKSYRMSGAFFTDITQDQLRKRTCGSTQQLLMDQSRKKTNNRDACSLERIKIISEHKQKEQVRRKHAAVLRCACAASMDLLLNFPSYTLHLLGNFAQRPDKMSGTPEALQAQTTWPYGLEAAAFVLFYLQFLLTPIYINWLFGNRQQRRDTTTTRDRVSSTFGSMIMNPVAENRTTDRSDNRFMTLPNEQHDFDGENGDQSTTVNGSLRSNRRPNRKQLSLVDSRSVGDGAEGAAVMTPLTKLSVIVPCANNDPVDPHHNHPMKNGQMLLKARNNSCNSVKSVSFNCTPPTAKFRSN